jgi:hypothetical protein
MRFALHPYLQRTRFAAAEGLAITVKLLNSAVAKPTPQMVEALAEMKASADALEAITLDRLVNAPSSVRPLAIQLANVHVGLREVLDAHARLEPVDGSGPATKLVRAMYPHGTSWVKNGFEDVWARSRNILSMIDAQDLEPKIRRVAGDAFVPSLRAAHANFGNAMGVGNTAPEIIDTTAVSASIDVLADSFVEYGRVMVGWLDWKDAKKVAAFRRAMAPLDEHRRNMTVGGTRTDAEPGVTDDEIADPSEGGEPTPPVTGGAPTA